MILLDTHVWVWWISKPEELSARASEAIDQALEEREIYVSSISVLEVALLVDKGRLDFTLDASDWILKSEGLPYLNFVPVDNAIALKSVHLPGPLHRDPLDRIIIATAMTLGALLISKDYKILNYPHARSLW